MDIVEKASQEIHTFDRPSKTTSEQLIEEVCSLRAENEALRKCCTQRGARMQIMRDWIDKTKPQWMPWTNWDAFVYYRPEAATWFDTNGVPAEDNTMRGEGE